MTFATEAELEERLSQPTDGVLRTLAELPGDILVLGVSGKMGLTLARMAKRGCEQLGQRNRRVIGAARFSNPAHEDALKSHGVETVRCDALSREDLSRLPDCPNIIYMAGRKFGTSDAPELTWAMNSLAPAFVAERFAKSRLAVFSTGCVYPNVPVTSGGSREEDPTTPEGEYAYSCIARERIFEYYAQKNGTLLSLIRLNYAIDLRYGVLLDIALKVWRGQEVDLTMGNVNVIWQGDANAAAIQSLGVAANPAFIINVTGPETLSVRALATKFAAELDREARFYGGEAETALLSNAGRAHKLFGYPTVSLDQMVEWTADWIKNDGGQLNLPTHFEARDGRY